MDPICMGYTSKSARVREHVPTVEVTQIRVNVRFSVIGAFLDFQDLRVWCFERFLNSGYVECYALIWDSPKLFS